MTNGSVNSYGFVNVNLNPDLLSIPNQTLTMVMTRRETSAFHQVGWRFCRVTSGRLEEGCGGWLKQKPDFGAHITSYFDIRGRV